MPLPRPIYLDYNATTPLDPAARQILVEALDGPWGNPSSVHQIGRRARATLDDARERISTFLRCKPSEVVFTSGGTESNNLAVLGAARLRRDQGRHLLCSPVEHPAVLHAFEYLARHEGFRLTLLPVDSRGVVDPHDVLKGLSPDTVLVSVMAANNETGVIQPIQEIGRICRDHGVLFHTDAVQWFGKVPFEEIAALEADLVSICAHKIHGPKGIGLLYIRSPLHPHPLLVGGAQENERRAGTENVSLILALAHCVTHLLSPPAFAPEPLNQLSSRLRDCLTALDGVHVHGWPAPCLANTVAFSVNDTDSIALLAALDLAGICASSGSACASGSVEPSHVLAAMGVPPPLAGALVRLSLGRETTPAEIDAVVDCLPRLISQVRGPALYRRE